MSKEALEQLMHPYAPVDFAPHMSLRFGKVCKRSLREIVIFSVEDTRRLNSFAKSTAAV